MKPSEEALQTYWRYQNIWQGKSSETISVSAALRELGDLEATLPVGSPLQKRITDLLDQIITDNHAPEEVEELANE